MDWQTVITRAEKGSALTAAELDLLPRAIRQLQAVVDAVGGNGWAGDWTAGTAYIEGQRVRIGTGFAPIKAGSYEALSNHTASADLAADLTAGLWALIAADGDPAALVIWRGDWNSGTAYIQGDGVQHLGRLWQALTDTLNDDPVDSPFTWRLVGDLTDRVSYDVAAADLLINLADWARFAVFRFTGAVTGPRAVTLPAYARRLVLWSDHTGDPLSVDVDGASAPIMLEAGQRLPCYSDGVTVEPDSSATAMLEDHEARITALEGAGSGTVLTVSVGWDPPNLANFGQTSKTITVPGAAIGDPAHAEFSLPRQDLDIWAVVTAADTVTVYLYNETGSAKNLGAGTVKTVVFH